MVPRSYRFFPVLLSLFCGCLACSSVLAQMQRPPSNMPSTVPNDSNPETTVSLIVLVRDAYGGPIDMALASLNSAHGGMLLQATTVAGRAEFYNMAPGDYALEVSAAGYQTVHESLNVVAQASFANITLKPVASSDGTVHPNVPAIPLLSPKAQKLLTKALDSLRANKPEEARAPLDEAMKLAPGHPEVHYIYGLYSMACHDMPAATAHWEKALNLYPRHFGSLMYLGEEKIQEKKLDEAADFLNRAIEVSPTEWRPHAQLAQADALMGKDHFDDAVHEAERALELGHAQAVMVKPFLANVLAAQGKKDKAIALLQEYLKDKPDDANAHKLLDRLTAEPAAAPKAIPAAPPAKKEPDPPATKPSRHF